MAKESEKELQRRRQEAGVIRNTNRKTPRTMFAHFQLCVETQGPHQLLSDVRNVRGFFLPVETAPMVCRWKYI